MSIRYGSGTSDEAENKRESSHRADIIVVGATNYISSPHKDSPWQVLLPCGRAEGQRRTFGVQLNCPRIKQRGWSCQELGAGLMLFKARGSRFWKEGFWPRQIGNNE